MSLSKKFKFNIVNNHWINGRISIISFLIVDLIIILLNFFLKRNFYPSNYIYINLLLFSSLWVLFSYLTERYYELEKFRMRRKYIFLLHFIYKTLSTTLLILLISTLLSIFYKNETIVDIYFLINLMHIFASATILNIVICFFSTRSREKNEVWIFVGDEFKKEILQKEIVNIRRNIIIENVKFIKDDFYKSRYFEGLIIDHNSSSKDNEMVFQKLIISENLLLISTLDWCNKYLEKYPSSIFDQNQILLKSQFFSNISSFSRVKRMGDLFLSFFLLLITIPIIFLSGMLIYLQDKKSIFYSQQRTGKNGKIFKIIKLRTMNEGAETNGAQWSSRNDPRITKIGKFLRLTRIDELPQLLSVIKGDMSLIGPRPERPEIDKELIKYIPNYDLRYKVLPGLSGWAQINYPYGASSNDAKEKLSYDLYYVRNMSIFLDLLICLRTTRLIFNMKGAIPKDE